MTAIKRILCWVLLHDIVLKGSDLDETLHYRCNRCGKTWPYYF